MGWKRGEINSETGMIYSHTRANGKEQWYSKKAWDARKKRHSEYQKTEKSKSYQKKSI